MSVLFNAGQVWTPEHYKLLKEFFDTGHRLEEMCRVLGRTPSAIISKLEQLGRLQMGRNNHYYPVPEDVWCMWQEVRDLDLKLKSEQS